MPKRPLAISRPRPVLRATVLLLCGALGVHEGRYLLAYGSESPDVLAEHGHGYLAYVAPVLGLLAALIVALALVRTAESRSEGSAGRLRVRRLWPVASAALLGIYVGQEMAEGLLLPVHPGGWTGVLADGGWIAVPLSILFGAVVALAVRVVERLDDIVLGSSVVRSPLDLLPGSPPRRRALADRFMAGDVLALHLAGRAPPGLLRLS